MQQVALIKSSEGECVRDDRLNEETFNHEEQGV